MMRGHAILIIGFLVLMAAVSICIVALSRLTELSGISVFALSMLAALVVFATYAVIVTMRGD
jgi:uncharacterized membrane protein (UPF0182 family)